MAQVSFIEGAGPEGVARWLGQRLSLALERSDGPVTITVPGGATPFPIFKHLLRQSLDWPRLVVWPNDDRIVPEDHPASNTGRIRALFAPAGAEVVSLSIMEQVPPFHLAWLGMGADGHIASLFPNSDPRADDNARILQLTPDPLPPEAPFDRITLTIPALLDSRELMFVIGGADKRRVFEEAVRGGNDLPVARLLSAARRPVTCFA